MKQNRAMVCGIAFLFFALCAQKSPAIEVQWNLWCDKTTEHGEDEVYILVAGKTSHGETINQRIPCGTPNEERCHWNLNDGKQPRNKNDIVLASFPLRDGESAKIVVTLMEEDGGTSKPWQEMGAAVLSAIPTGVTQAIGAFVGVVTQFLNFNDSDDYLGSFEVTITNSNGDLNSNWRALERAKHIPNSAGPGTNGFRFDGDGSNYYGWGIVRGTKAKVLE